MVSHVAFAQDAARAPTIITLAVTDPDVLLAMAEYAEGAARTNFLTTALKVGVLSLKAARGTLDSDTVRREGDQLMERLGDKLNAWRGKFEERVSGALAHYFDPTQGVFSERVNRLTKPDGDLALVVAQQVKEAEGTLNKVFEQFVGENSGLLKALDPSEDNRLLVTLQKTLDAVVQAQNANILAQFSLDNKEGALVRFLSELGARHGDLHEAFTKNLHTVVGEFSLDRPDSALSRLVARVEAAQRSLTSELSLDNDGSALKRMYLMLQEHQRVVVEQNTRLQETLSAAVQALAARREEAARGTQHGLEFEQALAAILRAQVAAGGDIVQETGATTGTIPNCKVGDHVITLGPEKAGAGARIVVEAKQHASYDLARSLEEADVAKRNRNAGICVFVHSSRTAQASIPIFQRFGSDIVLRWDPEDESSDVWVKAALAVATALSVRAASHDKQDAASFSKIDAAIERVRKHIEGFEEINTSANTARTAVERILKRAKIMEEGLDDQFAAILAEVAKLKIRNDNA